jgi:large subunit ribosomal protein L24
MAKKFKIRTGDRVMVTGGRDKGASGEVLRVLRVVDRVVVQGVNMMKHHTKADRTSTGGIIEKEAALHISNVAHVDPKDGQPTRVGYRILEDGRKVRFAKRSGEVIDA